jgi:hypothetical protein
VLMALFTTQLGRIYLRNAADWVDVRPERLVSLVLTDLKHVGSFTLSAPFGRVASVANPSFWLLVTSPAFGWLWSTISGQLRFRQSALAPIPIRQNSLRQ